MATLFKRILALIIAAVAMLGLVYVLHILQRSLVVFQPAQTVTVTIPEGATIYDIDRLLATNNVIQLGDLIAAANSSSSVAAPPLEGRLFPDTYEFFVGSSATSVIQKFLNNFNTKAVPLFAAAGIDPNSASGSAAEEQDLTIASIIQKEAPSSTDQAIIAGIINKRLAAGMYLDFDTTICYIKQQQNPTASSTCAFLSRSDFKIDSPYNTYTHKGLPPAPISNPGAEAIAAAIHPQASPYVYYLSDSKTGKIIYAKTLAEQNANQAKYLGE